MQRVLSSVRFSFKSMENADAVTGMSYQTAFLSQSLQLICFTQTAGETGLEKSIQLQLVSAILHGVPWPYSENNESLFCCCRFTILILEVQKGLFFIFHFGKYLRHLLL